MSGLLFIIRVWKSDLFEIIVIVFFGFFFGLLRRDTNESKLLFTNSIYKSKNTIIKVKEHENGTNRLLDRKYYIREGKRNRYSLTVTYLQNSQNKQSPWPDRRQRHNKREFILCLYLRNNTHLTVNCCLIHHCFEFSVKVIHPERASVRYLKKHIFNN